MDAKEKAVCAANILDSKKAKDIEVLFVREKTVLADYFVIAHGNSSTQVKSLADEVEDKLAEQGALAARKEGYDGASWVLLDYSDVIIHIFQKETRAFFNLEKIWADAQRVEIKGVTGQKDEE